MLTAHQVIEQLRLAPLIIEGGFFRESYRAPLVIPRDGLPVVYAGERNASTAIYYLLTPETFSAIHRVKSDEVFHFYAGDPVEMLQLCPGGSGRIITISNDLAARHEPQLVVPAGIWQGCHIVAGGAWALMGCTVSPGFDEADFKLAGREQLTAAYPQFSELIATLTPPSRRKTS